MINDLSLNLLKEILKHAPKGIIPGNVVEIRAFDCFNCSLESIVLPEDHINAENFIRCHDMTFAESGMQARCGNIENFAVEDVLHMGAHCEVASRIGCKIVELTPAEVTYFIRPKKHYCVYNPASDCMGILYYDGIDSVTLEMETFPGDPAMLHRGLDLFRWQDEMRAMGYTMLPMIWRSGACISHNDKVACLVEPVDECHDGNFSIEGKGYRAQLGPEEFVNLPVLRVLRSLTPIGQRLFLRLQSQAPLFNRLPGVITPGSVLKVHLDTPNTIHPLPGRVYVACLVRKVNAEDASRTAGSYSETIHVHPWELSFVGAPSDTFDYLLE